MRKWEKDVETFLAMLDDEKRFLYRQLIKILVKYEYVPWHKERIKGYVLSFKNFAHNRVIATMGLREGSAEPFFGLRFSSCADYSEKFARVIHERIASPNNRLAKCAECRYCKGDKFVYTYRFPDGETKAACGAFILEIPDISIDDLEEIEKLVKEQHEYFMKYAIKGDIS